MPGAGAAGPFGLVHFDGVVVFGVVGEVVEGHGVLDFVGVVAEGGGEFGEHAADDLVVLFDGGGDEGLDAFGGDFGCGAGTFFENGFLVGDELGFFYAEEAAESFALDVEDMGKFLELVGLLHDEVMQAFDVAVVLGLRLGKAALGWPKLLRGLGVGEGHGGFLSSITWVVVEFALAFFAVGGGSCFVFLLGAGYQALLDEGEVFAVEVEGDFEAVSGGVSGLEKPESAVAFDGGVFHDGCAEVVLLEYFDFHFGVFVEVLHPEDALAGALVGCGAGHGVHADDLVTLFWVGYEDE